MSNRGREFLNNWIAHHLPDTATGDPIAASDVADQMLKAAGGAGVVPEEINEEVGSLSK
ncbi:MAG: DUF768 domain-containing protein [Mesorhizobium sp.]|uniref:DUF768 domain-containing protein n=1 Tax=Mesorhizobium sp. TaxID=1871066 RepID=UPI001AD602D7|nr:hypothetical protein [Mesorhizobium sp.]MBN9220573.1 DUF768 domain-containing protein [Mesorhizobium sp.]